MKKGFISIVTLMILLILSLTLNFLYQQNISTSEYSKDLYNKKKAQYLAESIINVYLENNHDKINGLIEEDYKNFGKSDIEGKDYKPYTYTRKIIPCEEIINPYEHLGIDRSIIYDDELYNIKLTFVDRIDSQKIKKLYMLSNDSWIKVGNSSALSEIYFKVLGNSEIEDDYKIEIAFRRTY